MSQSLYSLGKNGPNKKRLSEPKKFSVGTIMPSNKAVNTFSPNGLFKATNIASKSNHGAMLQLSRDMNINKK